MRSLGFLFLLMPFIEIALLMAFAGRFGFMWTLAEVLGSAVIGLSIVQRHGLASLAQANERLREGADPAGDILGDLLSSIAGLLLVIPGLATDFVGVCLLLPGFRRRISQGWLRQADILRYDIRVDGGMGGPPPGPRSGPPPGPRPAPPAGDRRPDVIEGEYTREDD